MQWLSLHGEIIHPRAAAAAAAAASSCSVIYDVIAAIRTCGEGTQTKPLTAQPYDKTSSRISASYCTLSSQLSLAIRPWVGATSSSENRYTARCTSHVSVVRQCKLVSGWGLRKRRSAPPYGPYGSGRSLLQVFTVYAIHIFRPEFTYRQLNQHRSSFNLYIQIDKKANLM